MNVTLFCFAAESQFYCATLRHFFLKYNATYKLSELVYIFKLVTNEEINKAKTNCMSHNPLSTVGSESIHVNEPASANSIQPTLLPLDVIRGVALLGLLVVAIWEFGGFTPNEQIFYRKGPHGGNYVLLTAVSVIFEGKMQALFALVFGAGIVLFLTKQQPTSIPAADAYMRRQLWLLLFGIFTAFILLWPSDILYPFAVVGILLFGFWRFSARGLMIIALVFMLIFFGKQFWNYRDDKKDYKKYLSVTLIEKRIKQDSTARAKKDSTLRTKDSLVYKNEWAKIKIADSIAKKKDTLTKKQKEEKGKWEGMVKATKYDSAKTASLNKNMRDNSYTKVWNSVMRRSQEKEAIWLYRIGLWEIGSMMLLGMALLKFGFFTPGRPAGKYFLLALLLITIGAGLAWYRLHYYNTSLADYESYVKSNNIPFNFFIPAENLIMATGYAALILSILRLKILDWLWRSIGLVGTMALSNYLLQCLVCSSFFYGYAFGYFGKLEQWELYLMVVELAIIQIVFSVLWLRYFLLGPMEWLWSCLIYRRWLPLNKPATFIADPVISPAS